MITKQFIKTIRLIHSKNYEYKTPIVGSKPYLYLVVTRVNYLTASLWLNERNRIVINEQGVSKSGFIELPKKPNWLVMTKSFRQEENKRLTQLTNPLQ